MFLAMVQVEANGDCLTIIGKSVSTFASTFPMASSKRKVDFLLKPVVRSRLFPDLNPPNGESKYLKDGVRVAITCELCQSSR